MLAKSRSHTELRKSNGPARSCRGASATARVCNNETDRLRRRNDRLQSDNERLKRKIEHLEKQLAAARPAGFRQAAPFTKNRRQGQRPASRPTRPARTTAAGLSRATGCGFRPKAITDSGGKSITDSGPNRSLIPTEIDH